MQNCIIALDVGGTSVKSGIVDDRYNIIEGTVLEHSSLSGQSKTDILENFLNIIKTHLSQIDKEKYALTGIGLAFPGPFDYDNGICLNKGIQKFEAIYEVNVGEWLIREMSCRNEFRSARDLPLLFLNDATAFALGEYYAGIAKGTKRGAYITLGTGCGSTFLDGDLVVRGKWNIPDEGYIFHLPYKLSIVDDYLSKRGFLRIAREYGFDADTMDVRDIDMLARDGNMPASDVYTAFGEMVGEILNMYVLPFQPDVFVLGGGISRGYDLFAGGIMRVLEKKDLDIRVSHRLAVSAMIGTAGHVAKAAGGRNNISNK